MGRPRKRTDAVQAVLSFVVGARLAKADRLVTLVAEVGKLLPTGPPDDADAWRETVLREVRRQDEVEVTVDEVNNRLAYARRRSVGGTPTTPRSPPVTPAKQAEVDVLSVDELLVMFANADSSYADVGRGYKLIHYVADAVATVDARGRVSAGTSRHSWRDKVLRIIEQYPDVFEVSERQVRLVVSDEVKAREAEEDEAARLANLERAARQREREAAPFRHEFAQSPIVAAPRALLGRRGRPGADEAAAPLPPLQAAAAKMMLGALPERIPCRAAEVDSLAAKLREAVTTRVGGLMYISGLPGVGKTLSVEYMVRRLRAESKENQLPAFRAILVNCMKLGFEEEVYQAVLQQMEGFHVPLAQAQRRLADFFRDRSRSRLHTVLILDELDFLVEKSEKTFLNILNMHGGDGHTSSVTLIGIANTIDLPERCHPRVQSRMAQMHRLNFLPYSSAQLREIIASRLEEVPEVFGGDAVELVARKLARMHGDARRALEICREACGVAEARGGSTVSLADVEEALRVKFTTYWTRALEGLSAGEQLTLYTVMREARIRQTDYVDVPSICERYRVMCEQARVPRRDTTFIEHALVRLAESEYLSLHFGPDQHLYCAEVSLNFTTEDFMFACKDVPQLEAFLRIP